VSTPLVAETARWGSAWRRPVTPCAAVTLAALPFVRFGPSGHAAVLAFTTAVLVTLSVIDLERRILPNVIVLPAALVVLAAQVALQPAHATEFVLASAGAAALLFVLFLVNPRGMGLGDVKLALLLGAALGRDVLVALVVGPLCVVPVAGVLLARNGRAAASTPIPFGPFLAAGAIVAGLMLARAG
jgi:leader peptidase (prepilin peptidase)/N-methyltransferase